MIIGTIIAVFMLVVPDALPTVHSCKFMQLANLYK